MVAGGIQALHLTGLGGMVEPPTIPYARRPIIHRPDGTYSTILSTSFQDPRDGLETLIPCAVDGRILDPKAAWQHYLDTGEHLGKFATPAAADAYGQWIHNLEQERIGREHPELRGK
jgi:hypothetical protein